MEGAVGKIKVLYISHSPQLCGGEICLLNLVKNLDRYRYEAVVVLPVDGPLRAKIEELGGKTILSPLEWWVRVEGSFSYKNISVTQRLESILNIVDEERPDVIHTNTSVVFEGAIAAKLRNIPHIWHIHEVLNGHPTLEALLPLPVFYRIVELLSDKVVVVSNDMKRELSALISHDKIETVFNGIDTSKFKEAVELSVRAELSIPDDYMVAITVATIHKYKGHDNLLQAASLVKQHGGKIKYLLVGPGSPENIENLYENIKRLNLTDDVYYLGFREDIPRLVGGSDFFVLPSVKEGFPLVVLEAMALGKPIIATDCCGPADMIDDGKTGYLVPVARPDILSMKIIELAHDVSSIKNMGYASYQKYINNFTLEIYASHFDDIYTNLITADRHNLKLTEQNRILVKALLDTYQNYINNMQKLIEHDWQKNRLLN
jgi:glycosyltransferase involved in cell wall biosynthesis